MVLSKPVEELTNEYVTNVNKTYSVMCSRKSKLPKIIVERALLRKDVATNAAVLDFGAGKDAFGTKYLREHGFLNVTPYDIGKNYVRGLHDRKALDNQYDIVMMSSVLNIQPTGEDVLMLIMKARSVLRNGGLFFCNYPRPRKNDLHISILESALKLGFAEVEQINKTPTWVCKYDWNENH